MGRRSARQGGDLVKFDRERVRGPAPPSKEARENARRE